MEKEGETEEAAAVPHVHFQIETGGYVTLDDYIAGNRTPYRCYSLTPTAEQASRVG